MKENQVYNSLYRRVASLKHRRRESNIKEIYFVVIVTIIYFSSMNESTLIGQLFSQRSPQ